jgi:diaminopimelate epimerase
MGITKMSHHTLFSDKISGMIKRGRPFIKMHGLRNEIVIVDGRDRPYMPDVDEIVRICDRHEGVGGDELLVLEPSRRGPETADAYAFVRIFNPDGREVEACGNATRFVGWLFLKESGHEL